MVEILDASFPDNQKNYKSISPDEFLNRPENNRVFTASELAREAHKHQTRKSGEPYFTHCEGVFKILFVEWGVRDQDSLAAAFTHDVIEDTDLTQEQLAVAIGLEAASLVDAVSKLRTRDGKTDLVGTLKKITRETHLDQRVAILKLADRLHNMRTLEFMKPQKQLDISKQTMDVFVPLAEALGMWDVKSELEDLCFMYLQPEEYISVANLINQDNRLENTIVVDQINVFNELFSPLDVTIDVREKSKWQIWQRLNKGMSIDQISDLISYRIVCNNEFDRTILTNDLGHLDRSILLTKKKDYSGILKRPNGYDAVQIPMRTNQGLIELAFVTKDGEAFNRDGILTNPNLQHDEALTLIFTDQNDILYFFGETHVIDVAAKLGGDVLSHFDYAFVNESKKKDLGDRVSNSDTVSIITSDQPTIGYTLHKILGIDLKPQTADVYENTRRAYERKSLIEAGRQLFFEAYYQKGFVDLDEFANKIQLTSLFRDCVSVDDIYWKIGLSQKIPETILDWMDLQTPELIANGKTLVIIHGEDKPGIWKTLLSLVPEDRNISKMDLKDVKNGHFILRVWIEELSFEEACDLFDQIESDKTTFQNIIGIFPK